MDHLFATLGPRDPDTGLVHAVIDTPRGSRNKIKFDEAAGCFRLSRILPVGCTFPYDFGSIPGTRAKDGDALDVLVLLDEPTFPGCLITVRLIGLIRRAPDGKQAHDAKRPLAGLPADAGQRARVHALEAIGSAAAG